MKRIIRLTEGDLRRIVKRSANRILREFGSDGPDFDEPYGTSNMFQNIGMDSPYADSASDMDDFNPDAMDIYDDKSSDKDEGFSRDSMEFYGGNNFEPYDYGNEFDYDDDSEPDPIDLPESRRRMSRIIKESIRKVLREAGGMDFQSANNRLETVPEDVAKNYGFRPEYRMEDGTNVWGKYLKPGESGDMLLSRLGIRKWATYDVKGHVRIYVEPEYAEPNQGPWGNRRRKIGDYVDTEWADKDGAIFHNPKNGHFKHF